MWFLDGLKLSVRIRKKMNGDWWEIATDLNLFQCLNAKEVVECKFKKFCFFSVIYFKKYRSHILTFIHPSLEDTLSHLKSSLSSFATSLITITQLIIILKWKEWRNVKCEIHSWANVIWRKMSQTNLRKRSNLRLEWTWPCYEKFTKPYFPRHFNSFSNLYCTYSYFSCIFVWKLCWNAAKMFHWMFQRNLILHYFKAGFILELI